jgi:hypothetical protein
MERINEFRACEFAEVKIRNSIIISKNLLENILKGFFMRLKP